MAFAAALGELLMNFPVAETDGAWYFKGVPQYGMFGQAFKSRTPKAGQKALDTFSALLQQMDALTGGLFVAQSLTEAAFKIAWQDTFTKTYAAQGFPNTHGEGRVAGGGLRVVARAPSHAPLLEAAGEQRRRAAALGGGNIAGIGQPERHSSNGTAQFNM